MNNYEKGKEYEIFVCNHINKNIPNTIAYLWKDVPDSILYECNFIENYDEYNKNRDLVKNSLHDIGIDIIQKNLETNEYTYVQCKNYEESICMHDLAGYFYVMSLDIHNDKKGIIYTSNDKISHNITRKDKKHTFIHLSMPIQQNIIINNLFNPYNYQIECLNKFTDFYKENISGIMTMPCGTGKTYTSYLISKDYDIVIILSPLKQFAEQNKNNFKIYSNNDENNEYILVDSDGTRNSGSIIKKIEKARKESKKIIISSTYKSSDVIKDIIDEYDEAFIIIDEFHNLSYNNIYNEDDDLNIIIKSNHKKLYMSATPRIYELEDNDDCDIEKILGKKVYTMGFKYAIENNLISNYDIYIPTNDDFNDFIEIIKKEEKKFESELYKKVFYYFESIKLLGNLKTIIYFQSHEHIDKFIECFNEINGYYFYKYNIDKITCKDSRKDRNSKLNKFQDYDGISILCSVEILDECIDVPKCDSVYITYECKSKVKIIQRISRALRKHDNKIAKILVWCNKINDLIKFISSIKEYDCNIENRIKYIKCENKFKKLKEIQAEQEYYVQKYTEKINSVIVYDENVKYENNKKTGNILKIKKIYQCENCDKKFDKKYNYDVHINRVNPCDSLQLQKKIINEIKDRELIESSIILKHSINITDEYIKKCINENKCAYCENIFSNKNNTIYHIKNSCKKIREIENEKNAIFAKSKKNIINQEDIENIALEKKKINEEKEKIENDKKIFYEEKEKFNDKKTIKELREQNIMIISLFNKFYEKYKKSNSANI
jgi:superfamily II DNA or RNA helicase